MQDLLTLTGLRSIPMVDLIRVMAISRQQTSTSNYQAPAMKTLQYKASLRQFKTLPKASINSLSRRTQHKTLHDKHHSKLFNNRYMAVITRTIRCHLVRNHTTAAQISMDHGITTALIIVGPGTTGDPVLADHGIIVVQVSAGPGMVVIMAPVLAVPGITMDQTSVHPGTTIDQVSARGAMVAAGAGKARQHR